MTSKRNIKNRLERLEDARRERERPREGPAPPRERKVYVGVDLGSFPGAPSRDRIEDAPTVDVYPDANALPDKLANSQVVGGTLPEGDT